ncbi:unnamed protein product [Symbiodinium sp. CCMP2592]|nr:unnamed protein product [Symbiodinium sp. CCMP2592]
MNADVMTPELENSISKNLSRILRYEAYKYDISQDRNGFIMLEEFIEKSNLGYTQEQVLYVAERSAGGRGKRFQVDYAAKGIVRLKAYYRNAPKDEGKSKPSGKANGRSGKNGTSENGYSRSDGFRDNHASAGSSSFETGREKSYGTQQPKAQEETAAGKGKQSYYANPSREPWETTGSGATEPKMFAWDHGRKQCWNGSSEARSSAAAPAPAWPTDSASSQPKATEDAGEAQEGVAEREEWHKLLDDDNRPYYYHLPTQEYFYKEEASKFGWTQYDHDGCHWWCHESGRFFFEPNGN